MSPVLCDRGQILFYCPPVLLEDGCVPLGILPPALLEDGCVPVEILPPVLLEDGC